MTIMNNEIKNINSLVHKLAQNTSFNASKDNLSFYSCGEDGAFRTIYEMLGNLLGNKEEFIKIGVNADKIKNKSFLKYLSV